MLFKHHRKKGPMFNLKKADSKDSLDQRRRAYTAERRPDPLGRLIAKKRKDRGETQEQFAKGLGMTQSAISKLELGETRASRDTISAAYGAGLVDHADLKACGVYSHAHR